MSLYIIYVSCDNAPIPMCALNALTIDVIVLAVWQQRNLFFKTINEVMGMENLPSSSCVKMYYKVKLKLLQP